MQTGGIEQQFRQASEREVVRPSWFNPWRRASDERTEPTSSSCYPSMAEEVTTSCSIASRLLYTSVSMLRHRASLTTSELGNRRATAVQALRLPTEL